MSNKRELSLRIALGAAFLLSVGVSAVCPAWLRAQAPAAAAAARPMGTVKAISGNSITLITDAGQQYSVTVPDGARMLQLAPGSTDLKTAQTITLSEIAAGDRILVTGAAGESPNTLTATRVILMKSTDIAQKNATEQEDWQKRGTGGLVTAMDPATGTLTVTAGTRRTQVITSSKTVFERYAGDSIRFQDAKPGTLAQIQAGDQLRVKGAKSEDGSSIQAEEIVSGSFKNLAGTIASVDAATGKLTLKDLASKKTLTVKVTGNSDVRKLPPEAAARFAARERGGAQGAAGAQTSGAAQRGAGGQGGRAGAGEGAPPAGGPGGMRGQDGAGGTGAGGGARSAGMDLSQMLTRLPAGSLADLHVGDAVMIVASQSQAGSDSLTAVTLLSGVEPILAATPSGQPAMTLSPWNIGGPEVPGGGQ